MVEIAALIGAGVGAASALMYYARRHAAAQEGEIDALEQRLGALEQRLGAVEQLRERVTKLEARVGPAATAERGLPGSD